MRRIIRLLSGAACLLAIGNGALVCWGHGFAMQISTDGSRLNVTGGLTLTDGYATRSFDHSEESLSDIGPNFTIVWTTPGFEPQGAVVGLPLSLEIMPRPDFSESPLNQRWLWFWDPTSEKVEIAEDDPFLRLVSENGVDSLTFRQFTAPAGSSLIEIPINEGFGHHPIQYRLDDSPSADAGVYGFFARLHSPGLAPSDPVLVALSYNQSIETFVEGTQAINRAAGLPGDYDLDIDVDGNDFLVWQRTLGSPAGSAADGSLNGVVDGADLTVWRTNLGRRTDPMTFAVAVPEPATWAIAIAGMIFIGWNRRGRK